MREVELFGSDFERFKVVKAELDRVTEAAAAYSPPNGVPVDKSKTKKGKVVAKSTGPMYQFQIIETIGVPRSEIKRFADPQYWLTYFPHTAIVSSLLLYQAVFLTICD